MRDSEQRQRLTLDAANLGFWSRVDPEGTVVWDQRTCETIGIEHGEAPSTLDRVLAMTHPDDVDSITVATQDAIEHGDVPPNVEKCEIGIV